MQNNWIFSIAFEFAIIFYIQYKQQKPTNNKNNNKTIVELGVLSLGPQNWEDLKNIEL